MELEKNWPEILTLTLLIIGFIFGNAIITSKIIGYLVIFIWGLIFGRLIFKIKDQLKVPYLMIMGGFMFGFFLVIMLKGWGSFISLLITCIIAMIIGYYIHKKGIIKSISY